MGIPTRTKIERTGVVVSIASLLAVIIGIIAMAPQTFAWASRTSSTTFIYSAAWLDECGRNIPVAELPERPKALPGGGFRISVANTIAIVKICQTKLNSEYVYRHRSFMEYVPAYMYTIAAAVTNPETLNMSGLLLGGTAGIGYSADPVVSQSTFKILKLMPYYGVRFLLLGLFLMYFEPTFGRVLRFIWRGSSRA